MSLQSSLASPHLGPSRLKETWSLPLSSSRERPSSPAVEAQRERSIGKIVPATIGNFSIRIDTPGDGDDHSVFHTDKNSTPGGRV